MDDETETTEIVDESTPEEIESAKAQGWADKEDWRGDADKWKSAKDFLKVSDNHNAVLKERLGKLQEEGKATRAEMSKMRETTEKLIAHFDEQKKKAVEKAVSELKVQRREAISEGDADKVEKIDDEITKTTTEVVKKVDTDFADWSERFDSWKGSNDWYGSDMRMTVDADELGGKFYRSGRFKTSEAILKEVEKEMKRSFPDRFRNPNKDDPSVVEGTTPTKLNGKKKGFADLPIEAKKACEEFVRDIPGFTKEKYLSTYEWE